MPVLLIWDDKLNYYKTNPQQWCKRCGEPALQSWSICATNNRKYWVCQECDIEINEWMLKFMRFRNWKSKMKKYKSYLNELFAKPEGD